MQFVKLEPKYCELCGALCLRPTESNDSYCAECARRLRGMARSDEAPQGRTQ